MRIEKLTVVAPAGIECELGRPDTGTAGDELVLVISFRGTYPSGSLGNDHGQYMALKALEGVAAFGPGCLVVDLRELAYEWGNTLLLLFQEVSQYMDAENEPPFPIVVVASEQNQAALRSLTAAASDLIFDQLEDAVAAARLRARAFFDA